MDNSKALVRLTESADLIAMVDELLSSVASGNSNPATLSGIRITLRSVRESVLASHDILAADFINRARGTTTVSTEPKTQDARIMMGRKELRAAVEQVNS